MFLVGAAGDPLVAAGDVPLPSPDGLPLILPGRPHGLRLLVDGVCAGKGIEPIVNLEIDALPAIKDLVATQGVYTILPFSAVHREVAAGALRAARLIDPPITRTMVLAISSRRPPSLAAQHVAALVREQVRDLVRASVWLGRV